MPDALSHIQSLTCTDVCGFALDVSLLLTLKGMVSWIKPGCKQHALWMPSVGILYSYTTPLAV